MKYVSYLKSIFIKKPGEFKGLSIHDVMLFWRYSDLPLPHHAFVCVLHYWWSFMPPPAQHWVLIFQRHFKPDLSIASILLATQPQPPIKTICHDLSEAPTPIACGLLSLYTCFYRQSETLYHRDDALSTNPVMHY